jgi:iron complex transport system substrate-binding protein
VDQVGHGLTVVRPVRRIVTLAPDVTELVFALGAGSRVVAVPSTANYPPEAATRARVGSSDVEGIVALRPDLVVATTAGNDPRVVERLLQLGVPVCTLDVTDFARLEQACRLLARLLGDEARGESVARAIAQRRTAAARRAASLPEVRGLYVVWWKPLMVAAPGTFHDDLLRIAHVVNLAPRHAGRYPQVSEELLLDPSLKVLVVADEPDLRAGFAVVVHEPVGRRLAEGRVRVVWLPADPASRPGPRLPQALDALVAARLKAP